jgi:TPR repeat protein
MNDLATWIIAGLSVLLIVVAGKLAESKQREKWWQARLRNSQDAGREYTEKQRWFTSVLLDAHDGDPTAQAVLGAEYYCGIMVRQNYAEARRWLEAAAKQGQPDAQCDLGCMFLFGNGVPKDTGLAISWLAKASETGSARGHLLLGRAYKENPNTSRKAVEHYEAAAKMGIHAAKLELAQLCISGNGVAQDFIRAIDLLEQASTDGVFSKDAQTDSEARKLLEEIKSSLTAAEIDFGKTRSRDWNSQFAPAALIEFAAEDGDVVAQHILANSYWLGVLGFWHPDTKAGMLKWYSKASEQGYSMAQYELGWHYLEGKRWQKDVPRALTLLRAAAKQGHVCAQEELGMIYFKGLDVPADFSQAYTWLVLAGADSSETEVSLSQIRTRLTPVEIAQAEAAAKAFSITRNPLDDLGRVALFDLEKSSQEIFRLRLEADNGNTNAQFELGKAYQKSRNLPGSRAMAYVWFNLAGSGGHLLARKERDSVAAELSTRMLLLAQIVCREKIPTEIFR